MKKLVFCAAFVAAMCMASVTVQAQDKPKKEVKKEQCDKKDSKSCCKKEADKKTACTCKDHNSCATGKCAKDAGCKADKCKASAANKACCTKEAKKK